MLEQTEQLTTNASCVFPHLKFLQTNRYEEL